MEPIVVTVDQAHLVVAPLIVVVIVEHVSLLVSDVEQLNTVLGPLYKEGTLNGVVRGKWHQVSAVVVLFVWVYQNLGFLERRSVVPIKHVAVCFVPRRTDYLVLIVLSYIPDIFILQVVLIGSPQHLYSDLSDMHT